MKNLNLTEYSSPDKSKNKRKRKPLILSDSESDDLYSEIELDKKQIIAKNSKKIDKYLQVKPSKKSQQAFLGINSQNSSPS